MNWFKSLLHKLRQIKKYSASNPKNFEENWSFTATGIQLISLISLICILIGILFTIFALKGPFSSYLTRNDVSIDRKKLENQNLLISELNKKIEEQAAYLESIKTILSGETIEDSLNVNIPEIQQITPINIQTEQTKNEEKLSEKVKDDLRTKTIKKKTSNIPYFIEPVTGVISQSFNLVDHPAIDIVTTKDKKILACLSGTVIYSGYTQKDGFVIIIDHANGFLSVYKHAKTILKKTGTKVQLSDPIAIVGNSGENSTGPHLHFELWYNQSAVNPEDYMRFKAKK